jgi:hypothetical protein
MRWTGHTAYMGEKRNAKKKLFGKLQGKRPLETLFHKLKDIFRIVPKEI